MRVPVTGGTDWRSVVRQPEPGVVAVESGFARRSSPGGRCSTAANVLAKARGGSSSRPKNAAASASSPGDRLPALTLGAVQQEDRSSRSRGVVEHVHQSRDAYLEAGLLARFADRRLDRGFTSVEIAGREAPPALLGLHRAPHEEEPAVLDDHYPHPDLRLDEVHEVARRACPPGLSRHVAGREGGPAEKAVPNVRGCRVHGIGAMGAMARVVDSRSSRGGIDAAGRGGGSEIARPGRERPALPGAPEGSPRRSGAGTPDGRSARRVPLPPAGSGMERSPRG